MMVAALVTVLLLVLILIRVPIVFAILGSGIVGMLLVGGPSAVFGVLQTIPQSAAGKNALAAIPLFILMAQFVLHSGVLDRLFDSVSTCVGRMPGGTAVASVGAGAVFASVSGSSMAAAATLAHTSTRRMIDEGYSTSFSSGVVVAAGTLAAMIPPSVLLVFYAITAETSVGAMLIAGIVPGLLVAGALLLTVFVLIARPGSTAPSGQAYPWRAKVRSLSAVGPMVFLFVLVVGLVFLGITTATEAAALGVLGAFLLMVMKGTATWENIRVSLRDSLSTSIMILAIIVAAHVYGHFITETRVTPRLVEMAEALPLPPLAIIALLALGYLALGFFMDQLAIIALTVPVTLPIVTLLGYDPIWFGIIVVLLAEIGLMTPPLGLNVFVVAKAARLPVETVFWGATPFAVAVFLVAVLLFLAPGLVLFLPNMM
ncbi:TRAP transporter large permease [Ornithinimicrobium sp. LYQ92]|uniref:TRAP transporter large permease n=1 Tax=Serinicoccus sp. LYQ92 TaxID=3378798 RepID=UPI00385438B1